jgi:DNA-directed RNA polymerase II subunit RPB3
VATASFQYVPDIRINDGLAARLTDEQRDAFCLSDPRGTFRHNRLTGRIEVADAERHAYDGEAMAKAEELGVPGLVDVQQVQDAFVFRIEGTGVLPAAEVVRMALEVLQSKLQALGQALKGTDGAM